MRERGIHHSRGMDRGAEIWKGKWRFAICEDSEELHFIEGGEAAEGYKGIRVGDMCVCVCVCKSRVLV